MFQEHCEHRAHARSINEHLSAFQWFFVVYSYHTVVLLLTENLCRCIIQFLVQRIFTQFETKFKMNQGLYEKKCPLKHQWNGLFQSCLHNYFLIHHSSKWGDDVAILFKSRFHFKEIKLLDFVSSRPIISPSKSFHFWMRSSLR